MPPSSSWHHLLASTLLLTGCAGEAAVAPGDPVASSRLEVTPSHARLIAASTNNSVQLSVVERDDAGGVVAVDGPVSFWTRDTQVAEVDAQGTVTALEPGEATIFATVGRGQQARTVSMTVAVWPGITSLDLAGTYNLTMVNATVEPHECWCGPQFGIRWTATIAIEGRGPSGLEGTFSEMLQFTPEGTLDSEAGINGLNGRVKAQLGAFGEEVLQVGGFTLFARSLASGLIVGRFKHPWNGSSFAWEGTFELRRR